jgi:hypothetical protein
VPFAGSVIEFVGEAITALLREVRHALPVREVMAQ